MGSNTYSYNSPFPLAFKEKKEYLPKTDSLFGCPEMEVTEIILAKVSRLCQLSSHSSRFLPKTIIFKFIGLSLQFFSLAHKTQFYDTKLQLKVVFANTVLVKFKISNKSKQNIDETH